MKTILTILFLVFMIGCAVPGNYPINTRSSVYAAELPSTWKWKGNDRPALWEKAGHSKIFFAQWDDPKIALERAEEAARRGSIIAQKDSKEIQTLIDKNLIIIRIALFYISAEELLLRQGQLEINFADGTTIKDQGVLFWEKERSDAVKHDSRRETLHLNRNWRKGGEPLLLRILIPRQYLGVEVTSINFAILE